MRLWPTKGPHRFKIPHFDLNGLSTKSSRRLLISCIRESTSKGSELPDDLFPTRLLLSLFVGSFKERDACLSYRADVRIRGLR